MLHFFKLILCRVEQSWSETRNYQSLELNFLSREVNQWKGDVYSN